MSAARQDGRAQQEHEAQTSRGPSRRKERGKGGAGAGEGTTQDGKAGGTSLLPRWERNRHTAPPTGVTDTWGSGAGGGTHTRRSAEKGGRRESEKNGADEAESKVQARVTSSAMEREKEESLPGQSALSSAAVSRAPLRHPLATWPLAGHPPTGRRRVARRSSGGQRCQWQRLLH